jgi:type IV secretory pathway VirB10-like protein
MNVKYFTCAFLAVAAATLGAQQQAQQSPYSGTSNPPADDAIVTTTTPPAKPPAGQSMPAPAAEQQQTEERQQAQPESQSQGQPSSTDPAVNDPVDGAAAQGAAGQRVAGQSDAANAVAEPIPAQPAGSQPDFAVRAYPDDPDGDIVHPGVLRPGELGEGTTIRVRLLDRLSTVDSEKGDAFRSQVAADVVEGGQVLIPAGTEIDGRVMKVSSGHPGSAGFMRLRPETVILADGSRFHLDAEITGTPGSRTHVAGEGAIKPDSRWKRDSVEYGGAVAAGAVTGAFLGGPVGAVAGGAIGAGVVTTHLLVSHPQATLEPGTVLLFTLTEPLLMSAASRSGN